MNSLYSLCACDVVKLLKSGEITILETLDSLQERIGQVDPIVNSLPTLCFERARRLAVELQARPVGQRGPLCGLPVTIKDLTPVAGVRTTSGSPVFASHIPESSDQMVKRIESRGGIVYAKSNTPEFGADRWLAIAYAVTVSALPVITLPVSKTSSGLTFAVQLIGKPGGERKLVRHAKIIESLCGWANKPVGPLAPESM